MPGVVDAGAFIRNIHSDGSSDDPVRAQGKQICEVQACDACHGAAGEGTPGVAPALTGLQGEYPGDALATLLRAPTPAMTAGSMTPTDVRDADLAALVTYINGLK